MLTSLWTRETNQTALPSLEIDETSRLRMSLGMGRPDSSSGLGGGGLSPRAQRRRAIIVACASALRSPDGFTSHKACSL